MFRVPAHVFDALTAARPRAPKELQRIWFRNEYEAGRKTVLESMETVLIADPGAELLVGYKGFFANSAPMYPHAYQGMGFESAQALVDTARALYFETDPLLPASGEQAGDSDSALWGYMSKLVHTTAELWKCAHPTVFSELKQVEKIACDFGIAKQNVHFFECSDVDALLRMGPERRYNAELTTVFRCHVWKRSHAEFLEWFETQPLLFERVDDTGRTEGRGDEDETGSESLSLLSSASTVVGSPVS